MRQFTATKKISRRLCFVIGICRARTAQRIVRALHQGIAETIRAYISAIWLPRLPKAEMMASEINAAIRAYSIAVAPRSSSAKYFTADRAASAAAANPLRAWETLPGWPSDRVGESI